MKESIRKKAFELGFDLCGFSTALPPEHIDAFKNWISKGNYAEMDWMPKNISKRLDPKLVLDNAKSLIVVGCSYFCGDVGENPAGGLVARYARFIDYHKVILSRLKLLSDFIVKNTAALALCYVDTGPVLEREYARRAGLGFIGKHTNLISRHYGNWLLLGEILLDIEIEPDVAEKSRCGKCSLCIKACPTNAIVEPYQLDARKCISYLTIEHKGSIPFELRPLIGDRLFGCDDCLAVCPWNKYAKIGQLMNKNLIRLPARLELKSLFNLDEAGFINIFGETPIRRLGLTRLLRNAAVVLGNIGDATALETLQQAATSRDWLVAEHVQWAFEQIKKRCSTI